MSSQKSIKIQSLFGTIQDIDQHYKDGDLNLNIHIISRTLRIEVWQESPRRTCAEMIGCPYLRCNSMTQAESNHTLTTIRPEGLGNLKKIRKCKCNLERYQDLGMKLNAQVAYPISRLTPSTSSFSRIFFLPIEALHQEGM